MQISLSSRLRVVGLCLSFRRASLSAEDVFKMDFRSGFLRTHVERDRLSASLPQQSSHYENWSQPPPYLQGVLPTAFVSNSGRFGPTDSGLDESTLARRTTAFRQLNGNPRPLSLRRYRRDPSATNRSSTLVTQPVLVRAYSEEEEQTRQSSVMPQPPRDVPLPPVKDFSIEAILRAIEPDIQSTLDSIAEICGRSRLSLANEYGSHIAPFGEIVAPSSGSVPVEEASAAERVADDNVIIADDDHSVLDGRDLYAVSNNGGLLENLRQTAYATGYQPIAQVSYAEGVSVHAQRENQRNGSAIYSTFVNESDVRFITATKEFAVSPNPGSAALLKRSHPLPRNKSHSKISTPAVLSETYLEARANKSSWPTVPPDSSRVSPLAHNRNYSRPIRNGSQSSRVDQLSLASDVHLWLNWLKGIVNREGSSTIYQPLHSAEATLRTVLDRHKAYLYQGSSD